MPDETLYIDRRFPLILLTVSFSFILVGLIVGGDTRLALGITGVAFAAIGLPVFWVKIAILWADHLQIGQRRIPYAQIAGIDGQSEFVRDAAASATGRRNRQQDYLLVTLHDQDMPLKIPVTFYRDGADGLAAKIMARVSS